jgi:hypothetical protein
MSGKGEASSLAQSPSFVANVMSGAIGRWAIVVAPQQSPENKTA